MLEFGGIALGLVTTIDLFEMMVGNVLAHGLEIGLDGGFGAQVLYFAKGVVVVHAGREVECELLVGQHEFLNVGRRSSDLGSFGAAFVAIVFVVFVLWIVAVVLVFDLLEIVTEGNETTGSGECFGRECDASFLALRSVRVQRVGDVRVALSFVAVAVLLLLLMLVLLWG
jgi:hypothetical protein